MVRHQSVFLMRPREHQQTKNTKIVPSLQHLHANYACFLAPLFSVPMPATTPDHYIVVLSPDCDKIKSENVHFFASSDLARLTSFGVTRFERQVTKHTYFLWLPSNPLLSVAPTCILRCLLSAVYPVQLFQDLM